MDRVTSPANYVLTPTQREQIAQDLTVAIDEGLSMVEDDTLAALGLVRDGCRVVLAERGL